eukprot:5384469-Pyramimonas_sp.AAC.1
MRGFLFDLGRARPKSNRKPLLCSDVQLLWPCIGSGGRAGVTGRCLNGTILNGRRLGSVADLCRRIAALYFDLL